MKTTLSLTPQQTVERFISAFNAIDRKLLNQIWCSPCIFMIGSETKMYEKYSDAVDFKEILNSGWSYSKINWIESQYESDELALIRFNFSRFCKDHKELNQHTVFHLLRLFKNEWRISSLIMNKISEMSGVASK